MVAGHLQEKYGCYYMVLSYTDSKGKRQPVWIPTKLPVKGNKKRADAMLQENRHTFDPIEDEKRREERAEIRKLKNPAAAVEQAITSAQDKDDILFADWLYVWLKYTKPRVDVTTYAGYEDMVERKLAPYFREQGYTLKTLDTDEIQAFYDLELERVKVSTVKHHHAMIHSALRLAKKKKLIFGNPDEETELPEAEKYIPDFYNAEELAALFEAARGTRWELLVLFGAFYGMRRGEVLGLRWDAIDFSSDTFVIRHTIGEAKVNGKRVEVGKNRAKTKSSLRSLPLDPQIKELLRVEKARQEENRRLFKRAYHMKDWGYVFVNDLGDRVRLNYVSENYPKFLEEHDLRHIRYHDLRHSCASVLLAQGASLKSIQEYLGHSDFSTTANLYAHLDYHSKQTNVNLMRASLIPSQQ